MQYYPRIIPPSSLISCDIPADDIRAVIEGEETLSASSYGDKEMKALAWARLNGTCPPYGIGRYSPLETWSQYMGLTLILGFFPEPLADMRLHELIQLKGEGILYEILIASQNLDHPFLIPVERLNRLDGLNVFNFLDVFDENQRKWIFKMVLGQLRFDSRAIIPAWLSSDLANKDKLHPSEFVRWALKHDICIPWLDFAKRHYPHLLPESSGSNHQPAKPEDKDPRDHASSTEPRKPGNKANQRMVKAYWYAKECLAKNPKQRKAEIVKEAIEKYFSGENETTKEQKASSLNRYLTPSGMPEWAKAGKPEGLERSENVEN